MVIRTLILALCASGILAQPSPEEFQKQAQRCRALLKTSLIEFYLPDCVDPLNGGYYEDLKDGNFAGRGEKFLTLQARQLWFFSTLAVEGFEKETALRAAKHGYEFIQKYFHDRTHGGYFSKVTDAGEPSDTRKHAYLNSFALYGLATYARASGNSEALNAAIDLFRQLERHAYDKKFGGYIEFFDRQWSEVTDVKEQGYVGAIGHKTYNTHLHLLESFTELYRSWPQPELARRIHELLAINISTVQHPEVNANIDAFHRDWRMVMEPRNLRASYGHDVECIWLSLDAADALGMPRMTLRSWAQGLGEYAMKFGYDEAHGGFYDSGPIGKPADAKRKTWWVQTEALLGLLELYRLTGDEKYYRAFVQTLDFCEQHQIAEEGGWWATRAGDGSATEDKTRTSMWQGGYHAGRALMYAAKWLEQLSGSR